MNKLTYSWINSKHAVCLRSCLRLKADKKPVSTITIINAQGVRNSATAVEQLHAAQHLCLALKPVESTAQWLAAP